MIAAAGHMPRRVLSGAGEILPAFFGEISETP